MNGVEVYIVSTMLTYAPLESPEMDVAAHGTRGDDKAAAVPDVLVRARLFVMEVPETRTLQRSQMACVVCTQKKCQCL